MPRATCHQNTPENERTNNAKRRSVRSERLSERGEDDQNKFEAIHLLTSDLVSQPTEAKLADDCAGGGCNFNGRIGRLWNRSLVAVLPIDRSKHVRHNANGEDVVGILLQ